MSSRTTTFTPARSAGPLPPRTAVVHTLPATRRPGRRDLAVGAQLGRRSSSRRGADDVEIAVLLVLVGAAVTEIALWGRRQQASSSARAGYLDGLMTTSRVVAGRLPPDELVGQVASSIADLLGADACRFVSGVGSAHRAVLEPDGTVTVRGRVTNVERDGMPTMEETVLPVRLRGVEHGHFLITASTRIVRPTLEQRRVAVLLANVVGTALTSQPGAGEVAPAP